MNNNSNKIPTLTYVLSVVFVSLLVFFGLILITNLLKDGLTQLAILVGAIVIFAALVYLQKKFTPYRWLFIAIVFVLLFTIYPIISTVLISFSNMSGGHLITKEQAVDRLENKTYLPDGASVYSWTVYKKGQNSYYFIFKNKNDIFYFAEPGKDFVFLGGEITGYGETDSSGFPLRLDGYKRVLFKDTVGIIDKLGSFSFKKDRYFIQIQSLNQASELEQKYAFIEDKDEIIDNQTGVIYKPLKGTFTSDSGDELIPGFKINIGTTNYSRFLKNPGYREPTGRIIIWNLSFAFFSVALSFILGLTIALVFDKLPGRGIIRTLLIIPYPIPVLVSITVWKGLLNESMGLITNVLQNIFGSSPHFFTDKNWSRIVLILINVYLSYPYFYILASGAIRSIPGDILEAAEIDGAGNFIKLKAIILPLILKILAPLLIASFSFNFNNFTLIWGFNAGLPAMADTIVPMGYTDLLISFVYRLGFSTANIANYGFAAAITVLLFLFVSAMVFFQIRSTKALKEEN